MAKVTLSFECPEELEEMLASIHGMDWRLLVIELDQLARSYVKYGSRFKTADEAFEHIREFIRDTAYSRNLTLP